VATSGCYREARSEAFPVLRYKKNAGKRTPRGEILLVSEPVFFGRLSASPHDLLADRARFFLPSCHRARFRRGQATHRGKRGHLLQSPSVVPLHASPYPIAEIRVRRPKLNRLAERTRLSPIFFRRTRSIPVFETTINAECSKEVHQYSIDMDCLYSSSGSA